MEDGELKFWFIKEVADVRQITNISSAKEVQSSINAVLKDTSVIGQTNL
jgi:hypothetical protein